MPTSGPQQIQIPAMVFLSSLQGQINSHLMKLFLFYTTIQQKQGLAVVAQWPTAHEGSSSNAASLVFSETFQVQQNPS